MLRNRWEKVSTTLRFSLMRYPHVGIVIKRGLDDRGSTVNQFKFVVPSTALSTVHTTAPSVSSTGTLKLMILWTNRINWFMMAFSSCLIRIVCFSSLSVGHSFICRGEQNTCQWKFSISLPLSLSLTHPHSIHLKWQEGQSLTWNSGRQYSHSPFCWVLGILYVDSVPVLVMWFTRNVTRNAIQTKTHKHCEANHSTIL